MPSHRHELNKNSVTKNGSGVWTLVDHESVNNYQTGYMGLAGGDVPHNNIPPVIASYAWRRTA